MIIAGLGNPETKYKNTPHNIGFETIDVFAKENDFFDFSLSKKFKAKITEKDGVVLAKPQTYMNNSGESISALTNFYKNKDIVVVHDDIDLPIGKIKTSKNRGSAGHKGVESIIKEIGTKDFIRIRIGVLPEKKPANVEKYVLTRLKKEDKEIIIEEAKKAIYELINSRKSD
jgi:peptidyl-tRNA hydrolase, PTH1 family